MTAENPMFGLLPEIPWPKKTTEESLAKINEYRQQNRSLAASVALSIRNETTEILRSWNPKVTLVEGIQLTEIILTYFEPASGILSAESHLTSLEETPGKSLEEGEMDDWFSLLLTTAKIVAERLPQLDFDAEIAKERADIHVLPGFLSSMLIQMSPSEMIDNYTNYLTQKLALERKQSPPYNLLKEALELGRQRFHQLYNAAQEAGL